MPDLQRLVDRLVESTLNEVLRGFNFNKFKALTSLEDKHSYASKHLPHLGTGSSRTVYALSGGKALKIAGSYDLDMESIFPSSSVTKGLAQNQQEVNAITQNLPVKELAAITDFADDYEWLVIEIVKPFSSSEEFTEAVGVDFYVFEDLLAWYKKTGDLEEAIEELTDQLWHAVLDYNDYIDTMPMGSKEEIQDYLIKVAANNPVVRTAIALFDADAATGDIAVYDHWGKNIDGDIKLIDYGITQDLFRKLYLGR